MSVDVRRAWAAVTLTSSYGSFLDGLGSSGLRMVTWSHDLHTWSTAGGNSWPKAWQELPSCWQSLPDPAQSMGGHLDPSSLTLISADPLKNDCFS